MDLIVNICENMGIGKNGRLLVSIPADLKRFRQLTMGKTVIMGRNTLATLPGGKPLKGRTNYILSGTLGPLDGATVFRDTESLLRQLRQEDLDRVAVIGGASVYRLLLPCCSRAFVTKTFLSPPADAFFPNLDETDHWTAADRGPVMEENGIRFQYIEYRSTLVRLP